MMLIRSICLRLPFVDALVDHVEKFSCPATWESGCDISSSSVMQFFGQFTTDSSINCYYQNIKTSEALPIHAAVMELQDNHLTMQMSVKEPQTLYLFTTSRSDKELHNTTCNILHQAWANKANMSRLLLKCKTDTKRQKAQLQQSRMFPWLNYCIWPNFA